MSHSPGPWKVKNETVVTANGICLYEFDEGSGDSENDVDLIAAAPEMLEALEGAVLAIKKALPFLPADNEAIYCGEWLSEITEIIAKAKG